MISTPAAQSECAHVRSDVGWERRRTALIRTFDSFAPLENSEEELEAEAA